LKCLFQARQSSSHVHMYLCVGGYLFCLFLRFWFWNFPDSVVFYFIFYFFYFICTILFQSFLIWSYGQKSVVMMLLSKESLNSTWLWSNHVLFKLVFVCIDWISSCLFLESYAILHERFIRTYRCCLFGSIVCKMPKYVIRTLIL